MDPLSALSVAGTAVQFIDFISKLISAGRQLYKDGSLSVNAQAELATKDLKNYSDRMRQFLQLNLTSGYLTKDETTVLEDICDEADRMASSLIKRLGELKAPGKKKGKARAVKSAMLSISAMWDREEIDEFRSKLDVYRGVLDSTVLRTLR
jgi:hypothetical protein